LRGITETKTGWTLGAGTPLADLVRWTPGGPLQALARAASLIAAPPIQTRATIGGNLCLDTRCVFFNQSAFWRSGRAVCRKAGGEVCHAVPGGSRCHACHQADLPPILIALGAQVKVASAGGQREVPLVDLYSGNGKDPLRLAASELVTQVFLPRPAPRSGAAYEKLRPRKGLDFPAAAAAAYVERAPDGTCRSARVVLGAVDSGPVLVPGAAGALVGGQLTDAALEESAAEARRAARPVKNADLTPAYRRQVIGTLVVRAVRRAWAEADPGRTSA
jgi:4-hydroxybenzoyl-CoA reductase subunit beta